MRRLQERAIGWLFLAYGAEEGRSAALHNPFDRAVAALSWARLTGTVVNAKIALEFAERAVGPAMIAQR